MLQGVATSTGAAPGCLTHANGGHKKVRIAEAVSHDKRVVKKTKRPKVNLAEKREMARRTKELPIYLDYLRVLKFYNHSDKDAIRYTTNKHSITVHELDRIITGALKHKWHKLSPTYVDTLTTSRSEED